MMKNIVTAFATGAVLLSSTTMAFADAKALQEAKDRKICELYAKQHNKPRLYLEGAAYEIRDGVRTLVVHCVDDEVAALPTTGLSTTTLAAAGAAGLVLVAALSGDSDDPTTTTTTTTTGSGS